MRNGMNTRSMGLDEGIQHRDFQVVIIMVDATKKPI